MPSVSSSPFSLSERRARWRWPPGVRPAAVDSSRADPGGGVEEPVLWCTEIGFHFFTK